MEKRKAPGGTTRGLMFVRFGWGMRQSMMPEPMTDQARGIIIRRDDA